MQSRKVSSQYVAAAEELRDNDGQWAAYCSTGHCAVLAGPGSGKTKTLTLKLARVLSEDVRYPAGIACITYSQECARELDRRLEKLGVRDNANLFVGTIHGFCLRNILMPYSRLAGLDIPDPLTTATSSQQQSAFDHATRQMHWAGRIPYKRDDIGKLRRVNLDDPDAMVAQDRELAKLSRHYIDALRQMGVIDFDDQVLLGLRIVQENDWCLRVLAAKFPFLAVDEYQDLGLPLDRLVHRLVFDGGVRLFVVGDVDQSIYGFTGADGALLTALTDLDDVEDVILSLNYRSAQDIINAAQLSLGEDRPYRAHDETRTATIEFHRCAHGGAAQARFIVENLIPQILAAKEGRVPGDIAVLYRQASVGDPIAAALDEAGISYIRTDTAAPYSRRPLTSWIEDVAAWISGGWQVAEPTISGLTRRYTVFSSARGHEREDLLRVAAFLAAWRGRDAPAFELVEALQADLLNELLQREPSFADQAAEVVRMARALGSGGPLEGVTIAQLGGRDGDPDHLNLLTLHSAKGCEYDAVIMMGLDHGLFPWANDVGRDLAEQRRLFYVGLTRAKDEVHLVYSGSYESRNRIYNLGPSVFVTELQERLVEARAV